MRATATFTVKSFAATDVIPDPDIPTATPVAIARLEKHFDGEAVGRAATLFTSAFDQLAGRGTYVAMESFEGSLNGLAGTFNFAHSATTAGTDRTAEFFTIVPHSGTGELSDITGSGGMAVDADGGHRIWFDYELG